MKLHQPYIANPLGSGYELVGPTGEVIAWVLEDYWARLIAAMLNKTDRDGLSWWSEEDEV